MVRSTSRKVIIEFTLVEEHLEKPSGEISGAVVEGTVGEPVDVVDEPTVRQSTHSSRCKNSSIRFAQPIAAPRLGIS